MARKLDKRRTARSQRRPGTEEKPARKPPMPAHQRKRPRRDSIEDERKQYDAERWDGLS